MKQLLFIFLAALIVFVHLPAKGESVATGKGTEAMKYLPVQDGGRLKPYDTFAREALQLIYGKQSYEERPAYEIVTTWMLAPQVWEDKKFVEIPHVGLKEALKLDKTIKYFSPKELFQDERLALVLQELRAKQAEKAKLNPYYQAAQRLENQLGMFHAIRGAQVIRLVPPKEGDTWKAVNELDGELRDKFSEMTKAFVAALAKNSPVAGVPAPEQATPAPGDLTDKVNAFIERARAENPALYASDSMIRTEVHYNDIHPFMWTWILYLIAALVLAAAWQSGNQQAYRLAWVVTLSAFLFHTYGFALRVILTGRPPVSNMYETVVWVSWGSMLFAMIFEAMNRTRFILLAGTIVGTICLITANMAPAVLDKSMQPLEPVLRSTLWLTIHVLVITISYSAFFLAWSLGMLGLGFVLRGEPSNSAKTRSFAQSCYRALQIGVVLLAAGIILGGVWADYSWGRFWGWDPKETWAFIALLGYLATLHGRLAGWLMNVGMLASSIVAFNLVIMSWYGVNFVLGAGLHSYGFGAGGIEYVSAFVLMNLIYVAYVAYVRDRKNPTKSSPKAA